jgi:hypothetical protein
MLGDRVRVQVELANGEKHTLGRDDLKDLSDRLRGVSAVSVTLTVRLEHAGHCADLTKNLPVVLECLSGNASPAT